MSKQTKRSCDTPYKTMIGGQALIEGIMMLGPEKKAVVVRKPDGTMEEQVEDRVLIKTRHPALGLPFLRGVFNFCSSMANGVKALMYSASFMPEEEEPEEPSKFEAWLDKHLGSEKAASALVTLAVVLGICFSVLLFILLPTALVGVLGALWLTSRAGDVYLAWWLPLVGAACYYVLRRRCWLVPATAAAFVLLYFFIPNMQSLQWGSVVLYASMALAVAGPLAIGCAIAGLLHFAFGNRKEEKYADGKKH